MKEKCECQWSFLNFIFDHHCISYKNHCKLATLSPGQKPMLASRRYFSMSPASRQRLQFYNEFIKWWPSANNFQCCPRAFGPRATLEIIGFGSPLDKASLHYIFKLLCSYIEFHSTLNTESLQPLNHHRNCILSESAALRETPWC